MDAPVAEFVALVIGLRLTVGDRRPGPFGSEWTASHVRCSGPTALRGLKKLAAVGFLAADEPLPGRNGRKPTATYGIPGFTIPGTANVPLDRMPDAEGERGPVAVEAEGVGARGGAVQPAGEPPNERSVRDAVAVWGGGSPMERPDVVAAPGHGARGQVGGHEAGRYAHRPTVAHLLARAFEGPASARGGSTRDDALWLACQLRDNGHDEHGDAHGALLDFAARQPARFTGREALRILSNAYGRPRREPWGQTHGRAER